MSQNGVVDVTLPNGQTVSLQSIRALQAAMLDKHKNGADIPNKQAFVKNLGAQPAGNYASATVERLSEGVYLIKNVLEFNADAAWGGVDGGVEILTVTRLIFQMVDLFLSVSRCRKIRCGM
ncbi:NgrE [Xenorhabdus eapokensis]|uniref:NgrE n=2 Tax=Xenorhabdus eapokensis TaxID=1873482 RepID=A0A1Q5TZN9_9GAMM|nr:NgrE [Xenorhabdus eapokensis]